MNGTGMTAKQTGTAGAGSRTVVVSATAEVQGDRNLAGLLVPLLDKARSVAQARAAGKGRARTVARLRTKGMRPAAPAPVPRNNIVGLVGEILTEDILENLGVGEAFYVKWRSSGTSTSAGVDLVFKKEEFLYACESKHMHSSVCNAPTVVASVARELSRAFKQNSDAHTKDFFGKLIFEEAGYAAQCDARGDKAGRMRSGKRRRVLEAAIGAGSYTTNAVIVFDGAHSPVPAAVRSRIKTGTAKLFKKPVTGFLVGVRDLHDSTESMIKVYMT